MVILASFIGRNSTSVVYEDVKFNYLFDNGIILAIAYISEIVMYLLIDPRKLYYIGIFLANHC